MTKFSLYALPPKATYPGMILGPIVDDIPFFNGKRYGAMPAGLPDVFLPDGIAIRLRTVSEEEIPWVTKPPAEDKQ